LDGEGEMILVTGGSGMVGHSLRQFLPRSIFLSSKDCNLRCAIETTKCLSSHDPDVIIHLAARVGGIIANDVNQYDFFHDNLMINTNVVHWCVKHKVKLVAISSTCVYPKKIKKYPITEDMLNFNLGREDLHIIPSIEGAKSGGGKGTVLAIVGITLIAVATYGALLPALGAAEASAAVGASGLAEFGAVGFAGEIGFLGLTYANVALFGASLLFAGIAQMLAPTPRVPTVAERSRPENRPSFVFNGPVNVTAEGATVPIVYGEVIAGSVIVQGGIRVEDIPV